MPDDVHPQIQALIDKAAQAGLLGLPELGVVAGRAQAEAVSQAGRARFPGPDMLRVEMATTGEAFGNVPVRVYTPNERDKSPAIVFYHGGGHVICSLDTHDTIARNLAARSGAKVISVDYRLAPEHPFPAAVDDSFAALQWVMENAATLGINPAQIVLCGDSAGANLAAVTALAARDADLPALAAQVLIYPVVDYRGGTASYERFGQGYGTFGAETMQWFLERYLPDPAHHDDWRASLRNAHLCADLPPAYVLVAQCDVLHDEGEEFARLLQDAGVKVTFEDFAGMTHGFFGTLGQVDAAEAAHVSVAAFLRSIWGETGDDQR